MLADILEYFPNNDLAKLLGWAIGFMALGVLVFAFAKGWRESFKKEPTVDQTLGNLTKALAGLAPQEKVDALILQLANFVTKPELEAIRAEIKCAATKDEMETLRKDMHNRLTELAKYTHDGLHDVRNDISAIRLQNIEERDGVHNRLNVITEVLFELRGRMLGGAR